MESGQVVVNGGQNGEVAEEKSTVSWQVDPLTEAEPIVDVKEYLNQVQNGKQNRADWQIQSGKQSNADWQIQSGKQSSADWQVQDSKQSTADWSTEVKVSECQETTTLLPVTEHNVEELPGKTSLVWAEDVHHMERILKDYMKNTNSKFTSWKTTKGFLKESKYHYFQ